MGGAWVWVGCGWSCGWLLEVERGGRRRKRAREKLRFSTSWLLSHPPSPFYAHCGGANMGRDRQEHKQKAMVRVVELWVSSLGFCVRVVG